MFGAIVALTAAEVLFYAMARRGALLRAGDNAAFLDGAAAVVKEYVDGAHCGGRGGKSVCICGSLNCGLRRERILGRP